MTLFQPSRILAADDFLGREMTETRTLQFENARAVQSLYANDLKLIKNLEESLGVKVTTREGWIKMEGEPAQVAKAERVFTNWKARGSAESIFSGTNSITPSIP